MTESGAIQAKPHPGGTATFAGRTVSRIGFGVFACGRVTRHKLDVGPRGGRGEASHPSHVELFCSGRGSRCRSFGCVDVRHSKVGHDADGVHAVLLVLLSADLHDARPAPRSVYASSAR